MSGISSASKDARGDASDLASELTGIADAAARAATYADGEYIPQLVREDELRRAFGGAGRVSALIERIKPRIARLDGGEDGLRLAQAALDDIEAGRRVLHEGVVVEYDLLERGTVVIDAIATGTAGARFRDAAAGVRAIADIATIEATPEEDLYAAITRRAS